MKWKLVLLLLYLLPVMAFGQDNSLISYHEEFLQSTAIDDREGEVAIRDRTVQLVVPVPIKEHILLIRGKNRIKIFKYQDIEHKEVAPDNLYNTSVSVGMMFSIGESGLLVQGGAAIESDREEVSKEDYTTSFQILYISERKEKTPWQLGVTKSTAFGVTKVYPLIGYAADWELLKFRMMLPAYLRLSADLGENWKLLGTVRLEGGKFRMTEEDPYNSATLHFSNVKSNVGVRYRLYGPVWITASTGYVLSRLWELRGKDGDPMKNQAGEDVSDVSLPAGAYHALSIGVIF